MLRAALLCVLVLAAATSAAAQVVPRPVGQDPRIQAVEYREDQVVLIQVAVGYQTTVELGAGEQIENVALGDSGSWQVTANRRGDRLFIKPTQGGVNTNMTVITNQRLYAIELAPLYGPSPDMAYTVRFQYPDAGEAEPAANPADRGRYMVRGDAGLRPLRVSDDGRRTYIEWPANYPLPAVYSQETGGKEVLLNGHMREQIYVVDTVVPRLIFRIDRRSATATRLPQMAPL